MEENDFRRNDNGWGARAVRALVANQRGWKENIKALCVFWHGAWRDIEI